MLFTYYSISIYTHIFFLANKNGYFAEELFPIEIKGKKGPEQLVADEHPRETTVENLLKLKPVFKKNGLVSAGNASVRTCILQLHVVVGRLLIM